MALDRAQIDGAEIVPGRQSPIRFLGLAPQRPVVGVEHSRGRTYFLVRKPDRSAAELKNHA